MINVSIKRKDQHLITKLRWQKLASRWVAEVGPIIQEALKAEAPVGKKGRIGWLRDSIHHVGHVNSRDAGIEFFADAPYTKFVVHGTPAHVILPRNVKMLHWQDSGGHHFRGMVNHPGAKANHFPERAIVPLVPVIRHRFRNIIVESAER